MAKLEFSAVLSAVKPRERTSQYSILAGLYCLGAHNSPVTAKQVADILKLHLGSKAPSNINASLTSYTAYVERAEKGPPIKWSLTVKGLQQLRDKSGLGLADTVALSEFDIDVGIVCALEHPEFDAVMAALGGSKSWTEVEASRLTHLYRQTSIKTNAGTSLRVVGTTSTSMGLTAAAIATTHLVLQFKPRLVVMVGIAAGTRGNDREFGDVLVADPSIDYNSGKLVQTDGGREFLPDPYPIGLYPRIRIVLQKYCTDHAVFRDIRNNWNSKRPTRQNRLHIGPLGAADQVIDDPLRITEIKKNWRKLIGVEMETYGVYRACQESPEPKPKYVSFKAICDFAAEKSDAWQDYASYVAAEFTGEFLRSQWESLWYNK